MRSLAILFVLGMIISTAVLGFSGNVDKKVLMIIAPSNFRDEELMIPKKIFEGSGYKVVIASSKKDICVGMLSLKVKPDLLLSEVNVDDFLAVVLVGGVGVQRFFDDDVVHAIVQEANSKGKVIGAICLAPVVLANSGILNGRKASVWPSAHVELEKMGVEYIPNQVVVDGNIVTAPGPNAAEPFAKQILKLINTIDK